MKKDAALSLSLAGVWTLHTDHYKLSAHVPGDVLHALLQADKIEDPFLGENERDVQWVFQREWHYTHVFDVPEDFLSHPQQTLYIESLDTLATLQLNGERLGDASESMMEACLRDVTGKLKAGRNTLEIILHPVAPEALARAAKDPLPIAAPISDNNRIPAMNFIRKVACHSGWDWAPCFPTMGIYGEVKLLAGQWAPFNLNVTLHADTWQISCDQPFILRGFHQEGTTLHVQDKDIRRWWPAGHGEQTLYPIEVITPHGIETRKIGFRTVEWIRQPDANGESMALHVNGRPIFCKGANWVPPDAIPSRGDAETSWRPLLQAAVDAHMNMLRIWGGGRWESEAFYTACDELGILLWHDCMFACMHYPSDETFLKTIDHELRQQIARLRHHPSIALWCGDNEILGLCAGGDAEAVPELAANYFRFAKAVGIAVKAADPDRLFWPSSPCNGPYDDPSECTPGSWHDDTRGDMHFWRVWHGNEGMEAYGTVKPRFCSEFGFQSLPSDASQWGDNLTHPTVEFHQKACATGNKNILTMMARYFRMPKDFYHTIYLSQVQQALAIEYAIRRWRSEAPRCMGTLYWQLNDTWPSISWSSLEYKGRWKLLHHFARRFYAPQTLNAIQEDSTHVRLVLASDLPLHTPVKRFAELRAIDGTCLETWQMTEDAQLETNHPEAAYLLYGIDGETREVLFLKPPKAFDLPKAHLRAEWMDGVLHLTATAPAFYIWLDTDLPLPDNGFYLDAGETRAFPMPDCPLNLRVTSLSDTL